jgi:RNA recognition motif-containing protein
VNDVYLMMDRFTAKSRGFAFVTMNDGAQANAAMSALNGRELNGRTLTVNEARPREERSRPRSNNSDGKRSFAGNKRW